VGSNHGRQWPVSAKSNIAIAGKQDKVLSDELIKQIVLQLPSFAGLVVAVLILYRQNERLIGLVERCLQDKDEDSIEQS